MNKQAKTTSVCLISVIMITLFPISVYANSSWRWISETRPYDVLPFVILLTLIIEIAGTYFLAKIKELRKISLIITVANILSFTAPYLFTLIFPSVIYSFEQMLEHTPFYTIGFIYLIITLLAEVPFVYFNFKTQVTDKIKFISIIIGVNVVTTAIAAITERLICYGVW